MAFDDMPFGDAQQPPFAEVIDLASRREAARDVPDIPGHVLDEVDAVAELWQELDSSDRAVRFEINAARGRVVASLCDGAGGVVHELPLRAVLGGEDDGPQSAA
jgi:hypothetical protein